MYLVFIVFVQNVYVVVAGAALIGVGLNYAYRTIMKPGGPSAAGVPAGYGQNNIHQHTHTDDAHARGDMQVHGR